MFSGFFKHLADGKVIGASGFANTAADAVGCFLCHSIVAALCPVGKTVTGKVTVEQKYVGNGNASGAGGAIIAAAAELGSQLIPDFADV